jgi:hypothetical protein
MADIFDEVKEELAQERYNKIACKLALPFFFSVAFIIIATLALVWFENKQTQKIEAEGAQFFQARTLLNKQNKAEALRLFTQGIEKDVTAYGPLSILNKASILSDNSESLQLYQQLINSKTSDPMFVDLAKLLSVAILLDLDASEYDEKLVGWLEDLTKAGARWYGTAFELKGLWYLKKGDYKKAQEIFDLIVHDTTFAAHLHKNAEMILSVLKDK